MRLPILALTAAAATASAAPGSSVTYNNTATDFANNATYTNLTLSQFDNTQGEYLGATLTGVTITINSLLYGGSFTANADGADVTINSATGTIALRASSSIGFTEVVSSDNPLFLSPSTPSLVLDGNTDTFTVTPNSFVSGDSSTIDVSFFNAYTGTGTVGFQVRASNPNVNASTTGDVFYDRSLIYGFANVSVTYTYTYTPVPEPSTYGMILGGLALAGAALRRRQKAAK